jgi:hypothetical protein
VIGQSGGALGTMSWVESSDAGVELERVLVQLEKSRVQSVSVQVRTFSRHVDGLGC